MVKANNLKGKARSPIRATFAAHDRTQLETVFDYPLIPSIRGVYWKQTYFVEAWLFFPNPMGITPSTYTKERFYSDLRPLMRFREPRFSYRDLRGLTELKAPLSVLQSYISGVNEGHPNLTIQKALSEARLFGCTFASYFLKRIANRTKIFRRLNKRVSTEIANHQIVKEEFEFAISETLEVLSKGFYLLREIRSLRQKSEELELDYLGPLNTELLLVDEYCTYRFRDGLASLMRELLDFDERLIPGTSLKKILTRCFALNRLERRYSMRCKFVWIDPDSPESDIEIYMYRRGTLKRRMWSILYLKIRNRPLFTLQRQFGAMAAAGIAALWWVVAMYFISTKGGAFLSATASSKETVDHFWQSSGFLIVTASMIAYILKDRIKENGRNFLSGRVIKWIPDNSDRILYEPPNEAPIEVGNIHEYTRFVNPDNLPLDVKELRQRSFRDELEADDSPSNIIHYRKVIELYPHSLSKIEYSVRAIHDILRINIASYLTRLDDPQAGTDILAADGKLASMKMPKVYHMDIALKHSLAGASKKSNQVFIDHFRLVINKKGILRVEKLP